MPKCLHVKLTSTVVLYVPDDFPVNETDLKLDIQYEANNYRDGRYPLATELMANGAARVVKGGILKSLFDFFSRKLSPLPTTTSRQKRDKMVDKEYAKIMSSAYSNGALHVEVERITKDEEE